MVSSTIYNEEELRRELEPEENVMFERPGFERKNWRFDFANVETIDLSDKYVEEPERDFVHPDLTERPYGPSGMGEVGGGTPAFMKVQGDTHPTYRYNQVIHYSLEELMDGVDVSRKKRSVYEMFDYLHDSQWFTGISDRDGSQLRQGMFEWLKSAIPTERTFDLENYDGDTGDTADYVANDEHQNIVKYDAMSAISGRLVDSNQFDAIIGRRSALNRLDLKTGTADSSETYWDRLHAEEGSGETGINRRIPISDQLTFSEAPKGYDPITTDLTGVLGPNEAIVLPDLEKVRSKYWRIMEQPEPVNWVTEKEGGRVSSEYLTRYTHLFDPYNAYSDAPDAIHLTNMDVFFK